MNFPVRVLQIARNAPVFGFDYNRAISQAFIGNDFQVTTVFMSGKLDKEHVASYVGDVICLDVDKISVLKRPWAVALKLLPLCKRAQFDLAICHHYRPTAAVNFLLKFIDIPKVYSVVHDYDYFNPKKSQTDKRKRFAEKKMDSRCKLVAVSHSVRKNVLESLPHMSPDQCMIIHNAIDSDDIASRKIEREEARRQLGISDDEFVFGTVGRLVPFKAHSELIEAFAKVHRSMPNSRLVIIGDGKLYGALSAQISRKSLADRIKLIGLLPRAAQYMSSFDVFVLPSHNEPFGLVLLEAMANSLPIIGANSGGIPEVISAFGGLFAAGDVGAMAGEMLEYFRMPESDRRKIGARGYQHLQDNFNLANYQSKYRELAYI